LGEQLQAAVGSHSRCGEVRSIGMLAAVELVEDPVTRRHFDPAQKVGASVAAKLLEQGVIARAMPHSDIIGYAPPFSLTAADVDQIAAATSHAVRAVLGD